MRGQLVPSLLHLCTGLMAAGAPGLACDLGSSGLDVLVVVSPLVPCTPLGVEGACPGGGVGGASGGACEGVAVRFGTWP